MYKTHAYFLGCIGIEIEKIVVNGQFEPIEGQCTEIPGSREGVRFCPVATELLSKGILRFHPLPHTLLFTLSLSLIVNRLDTGNAHTGARSRLWRMTYSTLFEPLKRKAPNAGEHLTSSYHMIQSASFRSLHSVLHVQHG